MARLARVIAVGIPHHITQRGNARQYILSEDADRIVYLDLLKRYCQLYELALAGYCLMSNHVHPVAIPGADDVLAQTLKQTHGRYATYWNVTHRSSGHVWQGRFYSCPLGAGHLWMALRYCERNPVRARMVGAPQDWKWSSAAAHCGAESSGMPLEMERAGGSRIGIDFDLPQRISTIKYYRKVIRQRHPGWPTLCGLGKGWAALGARPCLDN